MVFEQVSIYDNGDHFAAADIGFLPAKTTAAPAIGRQRVVPAPVYGFSRYDFGRTYDGRHSELISWATHEAYRELVRGFAFYGFELQPSTYYYNSQNQRIEYIACTTPDILTNNLDDTNATLMAYPQNATEFSLSSTQFSDLWEDTCENTRQWQVYQKSDWETIRQVFTDAQTPARWILKTPESHGGVVPGPHAIPIAAWSSAAIAGNAQTGVCATPPVFQLKLPDNTTLDWVAALLHQNQPPPLRIIDQGLADAGGKITIVGARPGDMVHFIGQVHVRGGGIFCTITPGGCPKTIAQAQVVTCNAERSADDDPIVIELQVQPFTPAVSVSPGVGPNEVRVTTTVTTTLDGPPAVTLTQNGATAAKNVPMTPAGVGVYTGLVMLDTGLEPAGAVHVMAESSGQEAENYTTFAITPVEAAEDMLILSADGRAELFIPAGAISGDGRLTLQPVAAPGNPADGLRVFGGPYQITAPPGISLTSTANLTLRYDQQRPIDDDTTQLYRWDGVKWVALTGTRGPASASAAVGQFGVYALMSRAEHRIFTSVVKR